MSTLDELIHYSNEPDPIGALMLTGEWGCGKTYMVQKELTKALKDTHIIVRVSLFGMSSAKMLQEAIRQKWLEACLPVLGTLQKAKNKGAFSAFNSVLRKINPMAGSAADVMVSMNFSDVITPKPEVEDFKSNEKKKVIIVYDDLERAAADVSELMGVINNYCENHGFNTIILANEEALRQELKDDEITYHFLREKTISQTVYHIPDYEAVIGSIIKKTKWQSEDYAEYLSAHEDLIREVFTSDSEETDMLYNREKIRKNHNFLTLTKGLQSFYRIYYHLINGGEEPGDNRLYSFLAYYLSEKGGIYKDGMPCIEVDDKDIKELYPRFSQDELTDAERLWITTGIWDGRFFPSRMQQEEKTAEDVE